MEAGGRLIGVVSDWGRNPPSARGEGSSGLGKPLKSILHSTSEVKIYTASITPAGLRCAGEVSDGVFPIWMNPDKFEIIGQHVEEGFAKADGEKSYDNFL